MARPRIFLSSTYYDLKDVRAAIRSFILALGYDPILNEIGVIPYGGKKPLDEYCYDEIASADIVVAMVGGRYGTGASAGDGSISQNELKTALSQGKQVYIFILSPVMAEFSTYRNNKESDIKWAHVDNVKIFHFIDELFNLPMNNAIFPFETAEDINFILKEQWSGLFQRLLNEKSSMSQMIISQQLNEGLNTIRQIVESLSGKEDSKEGASVSVRDTENPVFSKFKELLKIRHRVFFKTKSEMEDFLRSKDYEQVPQEMWDNENVQEWFHERFSGERNPHPMLLIDLSFFDAEGDVKNNVRADQVGDLIKVLVYDPSEDKIRYDA